MKIGLGGGCHWCTEAVFLSLRGVHKVEQGWVSSTGEYSAFSEAIIVHFDTSKIDVAVIIDVHLRTHSSSAEHSMRDKYRSAVYVFDDAQGELVSQVLSALVCAFDEDIITKILPLLEFKLNDEKYQNYYYSNPDKPFCRNYVDKKLRLLLDEFSEHAKQDEIQLTIA